MQYEHLSVASQVQIIEGHLAGAEAEHMQQSLNRDKLADLRAQEADDADVDDDALADYDRRIAEIDQQVKRAERDMRFLTDRLATLEADLPDEDAAEVAANREQRRAAARAQGRAAGAKRAAKATKARKRAR